MPHVYNVYLLRLFTQVWYQHLVANLTLEGCGACHCGQPHACATHEEGWIQLEAAPVQTMGMRGQSSLLYTPGSCTLVGLSAMFIRVALTIWLLTVYWVLEPKRPAPASRSLMKRADILFFFMRSPGHSTHVNRVDAQHACCTGFMQWLLEFCIQSVVPFR